MTDHRVFELIGMMLGAKLNWAQGRVRVQRRGEPQIVTEDFWQRRDKLWRIERSDGLVSTESDAGSQTRMNGGRIETGPKTGRSAYYSRQLLAPVGAYIWGRSGEDWRLTGELSDADEGSRIELEHVTDPSLKGHIVVDQSSGILWNLTMNDVSASLISLDRVNSAELTESFFHLQ